jgi:hypothetical protein
MNRITVSLFSLFLLTTTIVKPSKNPTPSTPFTEEHVFKGSDRSFSLSQQEIREEYRMCMKHAGENKSKREECQNLVVLMADFYRICSAQVEEDFYKKNPYGGRFTQEAFVSYLEGLRNCRNRENFLEVVRNSKNSPQ